MKNIFNKYSYRNRFFRVICRLIIYVPFFKRIRAIRNAKFFSDKKNILRSYITDTELMSKHNS